jgi:hypothetical protein
LDLSLGIFPRQNLFVVKNRPEAIQNLLFLAGGDIYLGGNLTNAIDGIVIATEQVSLRANANLSGYVIAYDICIKSSMVTESKVLENFTVTYNDLKNPFLNDQTKYFRGNSNRRMF